ncbi:MAG: hypothetical protein ACLSB9_03170 [Hydrogeniiclostridium mannosilyticum]
MINNIPVGLPGEEAGWNSGLYIALGGVDLLHGDSDFEGYFSSLPDAQLRLLQKSGHSAEALRENIRELQKRD